MSIAEIGTLSDSTSTGCPQLLTQCIFFVEDFKKSLNKNSRDGGRGRFPLGRKFIFDNFSQGTGTTRRDFPRRVKTTD